MLPVASIILLAIVLLLEVSYPKPHVLQRIFLCLVHLLSACYKPVMLSTSVSINCNHVVVVERGSRGGKTVDFSVVITM